MKVYDTAQIRNIAFVGHGHSGKTSLVSSLLYAAKATDKLGSVQDGTAVTDFDPDEIERKVSMALAVAFAEHDGIKLNFIDAPGYSNYIGDAAAALRAAESVVLVVHALDGIAVQTEKMWDDAERRHVPLFFAVTQMDRERAEWNSILGSLRERYGRTAVPITIPIGEGPSIRGVVDLISMQAYLPKKGTAEAEIGPIPADMTAAAKAARESLMEVVAEVDDDLMNEFLETNELTQDDLIAGLKKAIMARSVFPIFACGANLVANSSDGKVSRARADAAQSPAVLVQNARWSRALSFPILPCRWFRKSSRPTSMRAGHISLVRVFSGTLGADTSIERHARQR
ncbi:MAG: GTP-binding protein [Acidobacteriota bacterium]